MLHQPAVVSNSSSQVNIAGLGTTTGDYPEPTNSMGHDDGQQHTASIQSQQGTGQTTAQSQPTTVTAPGTPSATMPSYPPSTSYVVAKGPFPILPAASSSSSSGQHGIAIPAPPSSNSVPEFLYQLTKMLTGGHDDIIEWSNGRIEVHSPHKLQSIVLQKYFRHSKFASFQRQLNYFGFRKLAGKGKMAPCSYVNEAATQDIGSLLHIKRKTTTTVPKDKNGRKNAAGGEIKDSSSVNAGHIPLPASPKSNGLVFQTASGGSSINHALLQPGANSQQAIAQAAVGRGIRHSLGYDSKAMSDARTASRSAATGTAEGEQFMLPPSSNGVQDSLSQLTNNYQNSLAERDYANAAPDVAQSSGPGYNDPYPSQGFSFLSRNSSLIDLAMIPTLEEGEEPPGVPGLNFVDFPQPGVNPGLDIDGDAEQENST